MTSFYLQSEDIHVRREDIEAMVKKRIEKYPVSKDHNSSVKHTWLVILAAKDGLTVMPIAHGSECILGLNFCHAYSAGTWWEYNGIPVAMALIGYKWDPRGHDAYRYIEDIEIPRLGTKNSFKPWIPVGTDKETI